MSGSPVVRVGEWLQLDFRRGFGEFNLDFRDEEGVWHSIGMRARGDSASRPHAAPTGWEPFFVTYPGFHLVPRDSTKVSNPITWAEVDALLTGVAPRLQEDINRDLLPAMFAIIRSEGAPGPAPLELKEIRL